MAKTARERHLLSRFGITEEQYLSLFEKQEGMCAVCRKHQDEFSIRLSVDHNHSTGEIRGLLCTYCNHRVIGRHTDSELLRRAADHLASHTGWFVPEQKKKTRTRKNTKRKQP